VENSSHLPTKNSSGISGESYNFAHNSLQGFEVQSPVGGMTMDTHTVSFWTNLLQDDTQNFKKWWDLESGSNGKLYLMVTNDNPPKPKIEWSNLSPGIGLTSPATPY
jgi:hypothetical protein